MARKAPFIERTKRRLAILGGRALRTRPGGGPTHRSLFLHMPKCGGTSLSEAMYATVPLNERYGVIDAVATRRAAGMLAFGKDDPLLCHEDFDNGQMVFDFREGLLLNHMAWDTMLIHGHVFWSEQAITHFGDTYKYVTMMREPVARTVSNLRMTQREALVDDDMESYLASAVARRHAQVYLRYLTGRNDIAEDEVPDALALAKSRLDRFALIGFLETQDVFRSQYEALFGVRLRMPRLNTAPTRDPGYSPPHLAHLTELCAPDTELYRHAQALS